MDTLKSFKGYGKMDPVEDRAFKRKRRNRVILIAVAIILLVAIVAGVSIVISLNKQSSNSETTSPSSASPVSLSSSIKAVCSVTRYPDSCFTSLSTAASNSSSISNDPSSLFNLSLAVASRSVSQLSSFLSTFQIPSSDKRLQAAVRDCKELFDEAVDRFTESSSTLESGKIEDRIGDLRTWLSAAVTDQETCLDGFESTTGGFREKLEAAMVNSSQFTSNCLAIATGIMGLMSKLHIPINRKLLATDGEGSFPAWATERQRRVLVDGQFAVNVTVAGDGTGQVKKIQDAVDMVPKKSTSAFVVYVKAGVYSENVVVDKNKWNVVIVGDGMYKTVVNSERNFVDGSTTFSTATFAVVGSGFVAKDMGFKNSAGPSKHQAVALRSGSDKSIFYRCSFDAYQDTLYAHSNRQFYRECSITGTIDFIFGDAAVIFQSCKIMPREPMSNQANTITAQGKKDPNGSTGIVIQGCTITPFGTVTRPTYLGRPWKNFSTTLVMKSEIGPVVDRAGWMAWMPGTEPPDSIYYAEYENTGAGANVADRVRWAGYRPAIGADEAKKYTVGPFIHGEKWIPGAGVKFDSTL
ncbi:hypothetical protein HPP92_003887 [Vanilla planifolia]|uniref:Pectinesterase n=1 Tax=Vanilla planifolia TaxID=51239 RepID=A0A835VNP8_VANPL|nr:hypothetical protein HPP92_003887 [Vanilla planifolia]